jgi:hypothetical protein
MISRQLLVAAALASLLGPRWSRGDEVRYYERNGVTYCETRRTVRQRVPDTRIETRPETVYREQVSTEMQQTVRDRWTPVTEYGWETFWVGRWNPLVAPYQAYRYVPRTRWEKRTEVVEIPVTRRRMVPETRTVRTPVAAWRTVEKEVVSRVAVSGRPAPPLVAVDTPGLAPAERIGGVSRLDNDPPRYGTSTAWRPATGTIR